MGEDEEMNPRVIQNIHAPVYGHVAAGNITVVEHPPQERELTWWDLSKEDLLERKRRARSERWQSWQRYWINPPIFLIGLYCLCLLGWALSTISAGFTSKVVTGSNTGPMWIFVLVGVSLGVMIPLGIWLDRIRRVEAHVAADAQAEIDAIELVLRRRK